ncbi:C-GCAxxG-C-C family protein [Candidatus Bipolaricaulota bacterium]|nr:C-GCAxxG-C-C family protein [Candidatus Bipolaricaulota bacterium]
MIERAMARSRELFESGWFCAESVLMAVSEHHAIDSQLIPKLATGFCSGLSRSGGLCGALSGAVLSIGLILGRDDANQSVDPCYNAVCATADGFVSRFGADTCQALTGCHLGTDEGQVRFRRGNLHERCLEFVSEATRLALMSIANPMEPPSDP